MAGQVRLYSLAQVLAVPDAGEAQDMKRPGVIKIVKDLYGTGKLDGLIALGGSMGSALGAAELPIGIPKILVSTMAGTSGAERYVG